MEVYTGMQTMLMRQIDQVFYPVGSFAIELAHSLNGDVLIAVKFYIGRIRHWNANKIKAPIGHPFQVFFLGLGSGIAGIRREKVQKIEPFPLGNAVGWFRA
jgi:hypothetical protein